MKHFSRVLLFSSGVLVLSLAANAQTWGQGSYYSQRDDPHYRNDPNYPNYPDRGGYYNDDRYPRQRGYGNDRYGSNPGSLIERVLSDINMAASNALLDGHEARHFDEAASKLQEFEGRWAQGKFDTGKLDKAIDNLRHLADADRVNPRDRDMLARDIDELRQFRSTRGGYSNYGYGGYRNDRYNYNRDNQNRRYDPNWR